MLASKHITKLVIIMILIATVACVCIILFKDKLIEENETTISMQYEEKVFDTSKPIELNIIMDESKWNDLIDNALSEEYLVCDVEINGEKVNNVGIRAKGNTSLSTIVNNPDTERYSLKIEFDHFVDGQTFYGLDKLILNNNYADATNMKEALIYDMFQYLGADASLYNYAKISVNNKYWGVYLALEGIDDSFLLRNYGTQSGEVYKPDNMEMGNFGGNNKDSNGKESNNMTIPNFNNSEMPNISNLMNKSNTNSEMPNVSNSMEKPNTNSEMPSISNSKNKPKTNTGKTGASNTTNKSNTNTISIPNINNDQFGDFDISQIPNNNNFDISQIPNMENFNISDLPNNGNNGNFSMSSMGGKGGANLNYIDDDLDSYSTIWESSITDTTKSDHRRVVNALKNISEKNNIETYMDVDNLLKYMAVHVFSVNEDSLSGSMAHNYYLYEYNGKLNILPWDYNLSFGGMGMKGNSSDIINDAIDTPFQGTNFFDALLENEEYLEKYHEYLNKLIEEYINNGKFDEFYNRTKQQIDSLVESDPTAFYTYDEYKEATEMLYKVVKLRGESISKQMSGIIPSTNDGQKKDSANLIDTSDINTSIMGQMNMGNKFEGPNNSEEPSDISKSNEENLTNNEDNLNDNLSEKEKKKESFSKSDKNTNNNFKFNKNGIKENSSSSVNETLILYLTCFGIAITGVIFAKLFKRKSHK